MPDGSRLGRGDLSLLLLGALAIREMYGYELVAELKRRSDGVVDLPEGTVYPSLRRLERNGLIRGRWVDTAGGPRRPLYRLAQGGATAPSQGAAARRPV